MSTIELCLEVTEENNEELIDLGFPVDVGDELDCEIKYDWLLSDPSVGIMSEDVQVICVTSDGVDVERFFDIDKLEETIYQDREDRWLAMQPRHVYRDDE